MSLRRYYRPIFCRTASTAATFAALELDARSVVVTGSVPSGITVGKILFAATTDKFQCQCLGPVTAIVGSEIFFTLPARFAMTSDEFFTYQVFAASGTWWEPRTAPGTGGINISYASGTEVLQTVAAEPIHTRTADSRTYVEILFQDLLATDWQQFRLYVQGELNGGLRRFVATYYDDDVGLLRTDIVKLREPNSELVARSKARSLRAWAVDLVVVTPDAFL